MRIRDWSSDVCSSDLLTSGGASVGCHDLVQSALGDGALGADALKVGFWKIAMRPSKPLIFGHLGTVPMLGLPGNPVSTMVCATVFRSEEHTSELQSLMRISYAVFCLKKKKQHKQIKTIKHRSKITVIE